MTEDYGYINARIRAMKAELLDKSHYDELIQSKTLGRMFEILKQTPYGEDITKAKTRETRDLDILLASFRLNMERNFRKILKFTDGEPRELISILLSRYDIYNVKTILRGKIQGVEEGEIKSSLLPAGILDEARLNLLLKEESASSVLELLASWGIHFPFVIGRDLVRATREGNIQEIEYLLEEAYYSWALSSLHGGNGNREILRQIITSLIDIRNVMASLILLKDGIKPLGRLKFIEGGTLKPVILKKLENSESLEEGIEVIEATPYGKILRGRKTKDIKNIERYLEKHQIETILKLRTGDPLGISIPVYYIWAKEVEVVNLRTIAIGVAFEIPKPEIRESIIIP